MTKFKPQMNVYVIWHPKFKEGMEFAKKIFRVLNCDVDNPLLDGLGIPVYFRYAHGNNQEKPLPEPVDFSSACINPVFVLIDNKMVLNWKKGWRTYITNLYNKMGQCNAFFPIAINDAALELSDDLDGINFLRLFEFQDTCEKETKLIRHVMHSLCRLLRKINPEVPCDENISPPPDRIFISHAKKDGLDLALKIRDWINKDEMLDSFFDAKEIAIGYKFVDEIKGHLKNCDFLILQTDSYAGRPWCKNEVLLAKQYQRPMVVVNCLNNGEARSFPYIGNVPTLCWETNEGIEPIICALLREHLRVQYLRYHFEGLKKANRLPIPCSISTHAPELLTLLNKSKEEEWSNEEKIWLVYPDPPLGTEEIDLINKHFSNLIISTPTLLTLPETPLLQQKTIGISISEAQDLEGIGIDKIHVKKVAIEIVRYLLARDARIKYGGDLRKGGFTELFADLVEKHRKEWYAKYAPIQNPLAWPIYCEESEDEWDKEQVKRIKDIEREEIPPPEGLLERHNFNESEFLVPNTPCNCYIWARCLSNMREKLCESNDAQIVLGGQVKGFLGRYPGIMEEVYLFMKVNKPIYLLGGFGGCAKIIAEALQKKKDWSIEDFNDSDNNYKSMTDFYMNYEQSLATSIPEINYLGMADFFYNKGSNGLDKALNNGLTHEENLELICSNSVYEIVHFILTGLSKKLV